MLKYEQMTFYMSQKWFELLRRYFVGNNMNNPMMIIYFKEDHLRTLFKMSPLKLPKMKTYLLMEQINPLKTQKEGVRITAHQIL